MNSDFQLIEDSREADAMLLLAAGELASTMMWRKTEDGNFFSLFSAVNIQSKCVQVNIIDPAESEKLHQKVKQDPLGEFFFSVNSSKAILFFKSTYVSSKEGDSKFIFSGPALVYRVQRRAHLRYQFQLNDRVVVKLVDPKSTTARVVRAMTDLSAGGFSVFLKESEAANFPANLECQGIEFSIGAQTFSNIVAMIRHRRSVADPDLGIGHRLGFEFQGLSEEYRTAIQNFVVGQIQKYFQGNLNK